MSDFHEVSIDKNIIVLPDKIIQIANVIRVSTYIEEKSWSSIISFMIVAILLGVLSTDPYHWGWSDITQKSMMIGFFYFIICTLYFLMYKRYGIKIQGNDGKNDILLTADKEAAENLFAFIAYFVNNNDKAITINRNFQVVQGDNIMGDKFSKIRNSMIANRSTVN
jgi:hypothetical protein